MLHRICPFPAWTSISFIPFFSPITIQFNNPKIILTIVSICYITIWWLSNSKHNISSIYGLLDIPSIFYPRTSISFIPFFSPITIQFNNPKIINSIIPICYVSINWTCYPSYDETFIFSLFNIVKAFFLNTSISSIPFFNSSIIQFDNPIIIIPIVTIINITIWRSCPACHNIAPINCLLNGGSSVIRRTPISFIPY